MKVRPAVLIVRDDAILTMRYQYGSDYVYVLPGGNPDPGESLPEVLVREVREELGVDIVVGKMLFAGEVLNFNQKEDTLHCVFLARADNAEFQLDEMHTSAQAIEWILPERLKHITLYPNFAEQLAALPLGEAFYYTGPLNQPYRS